jgi:hypothetical protein
MKRKKCVRLGIASVRRRLLGPSSSKRSWPRKGLEGYNTGCIEEVGTDWISRIKYRHCGRYMHDVACIWSASGVMRDNPTRGRRYKTISPRRVVGTKYNKYSLVGVL